MAYFLFDIKTRPDVEAEKLLHCVKCGKKTLHRFISAVTWFIMFLIPLIPLKRRLVRACAKCGFEQEFTGKALKQMFARFAASD